MFEAATNLGVTPLWSTEEGLNLVGIYLYYLLFRAHRMEDMNDSLFLVTGKTGCEESIVVGLLGGRRVYEVGNGGSEQKNIGQVLLSE